ncbi:hypothetical protein EGH24_01195 [Halonotius terrestris]|uniref:DUF7847 domain-containing protein n=1 Tax=Halonotius terrestris TaxID=2487750 RepID=A0A8J8TCL6_9EURY|nr:hypothetical protein [Halonotius terrestris]TQQ83440.1 hypothetical protein EGH24_01195 [Halonotius terrestris]
MAAIRSLKPAIGSLVRNPIILVVAAAVGVLQLPQFALQSMSPLLAGVGSLLFSGVFLLFLPFYQGGMLGMADEARTGTTDLGTLIDVGKSNYISLLLAYVVVIAVVFAFTLLGGIVAAVAGAGAVIGGGQPSTAVLVGIGLIGLLFGLAYLAAVLLIQFYAHAIVLEDTSVTDGFKRSISLVRSNLLSAVGYAVIVFGGGGLAGGIGAAASLLFSPQPALQSALPEVSLPLLVGGAVVYILVLALLGGFYATYSVTFYRDIAEPSHARL